MVIVVQPGLRIARQMYLQSRFATGAHDHETDSVTSTCFAAALSLPDLHEPALLEIVEKHRLAEFAFLERATAVGGMELWRFLEAS